MSMFTIDVRLLAHQFLLRADCSSSFFSLRLIYPVIGGHCLNCGWMGGRMLVRHLAHFDDDACRAHADDCSRRHRLIHWNPPPQD